MKLINKNLFPGKTTYKYSGYVHVTTFGADLGKHESYSHTEYFEDDDLLVSRQKAIDWYYKTIEGLEREGKYFLPFASPQEFELGKHAAFSVVVSMVHTWNGVEDEYDLLGGGVEENEDTLEMEKIIYQQLGLLEDYRKTIQYVSTYYTF